MYLQMTEYIIFKYILNMTEDGKGVQVFNSSDHHRQIVTV